MIYSGKKLGFGGMRLPRDAKGLFDPEQTKPLIDMYMDAGFSYFDTAYVYSNSEETLRKALIERYPREKFQLATKYSPWHGVHEVCQNIEEVEHQLQQSLTRTGAGYFDFYLLHNLGEDRTEVCDNLNVWDWVQEQKRKGLIKHAGFSFHSSAEQLEKILNDHPEMEFVQLQINYADWENISVQSRACYEVAHRHGVPIIVMEPVKGGLLSSPPKSVENILRETNPDVSYASWAIRFAAGLDGVMLVLSGMSTLEQVKDNISYIDAFCPLSENEHKVILKAQEEFNKISLIPCTSCLYCVNECPQNISIAGSFTALNNLSQYHNLAYAKALEFLHTSGTGRQRASACIQCGRCERVCPQSIEIRKELQRVCEKIINA
ncbi:MAG: aldo/keto reductase [Clostridiales bacterium]|nr:aldo/keto reductase [Clostridiales bacterium]